MVKRIKQKRFKKFDVLVPKVEDISDISKIIIFVDKIKDELKIAKYLWLLLSESIYKKEDQIIEIFLSNWKFFR